MAGWRQITVRRQTITVPASSFAMADRRAEMEEITMKTAILACLTCIGLTQSLAAAEQPNVVVIFADDKDYTCDGQSRVA